MTYSLGIIGGGNMGQAIVRGAIAARVLAPDRIIVAEIDAARREHLRSSHCTVTDDAIEASRAEQVILAVKPQAFDEVARTIAPLRSPTVVMTIMAGLHTSKIRSSIGSNARMIRVMPNTPCQVGAGMTAIALGDGARPGDDQLALALFGAIGKTTQVEESLMNAVTAVSGSGPAYVFALAEAMEAAATSMGFDLPTARLLVTQTILGSGRLLSESTQCAAELRKAVTSPGGTTSAALDVMNAAQFPQIIINALTAARDRGIELGG